MFQMHQYVILLNFKNLLTKVYLHRNCILYAYSYLA